MDGLTVLVGPPGSGKTTTWRRTHAEVATLTVSILFDEGFADVHFA